MDMLDIDSLLKIINTNEFLENIFIGVTGAIVLKFFHFLYTKIINYIYLNSHFSVSGVWIASFDSYIENKKNIEIIKIKQNQESISIYGEQYNSLSEKVKKYYGKGVFRGSDMIIVYYPVDKQEVETGAIILRVIHTADKPTYLSGIATGFIHAQKSVKIMKVHYELHRLNIPIFIKLKKLINKDSFSSYEEVLKCSPNTKKIVN